MRSDTTMRVARPTDKLALIKEMYMKGLGLSVLAEFVDHEGFDGVILGQSGNLYHLEFTSHRGHTAGKAPSKDHLWVFYVPDRREWQDSCARMLTAGFHQVPSDNPYWDLKMSQ
ncbi:MAG TPA: hypothetical protein VJ023_18985 [Pyrinomonadaceae bacterium]|nr:hypothetical protein [Pyrinomonadaceae bacterium]